ncbi:MBL fold metallo-hydrolase [Kitasatospora viridis]|uniref:Metallo-beta-lactamase superfamily protein n=1 Tax=Kitasatospora viridis TaxID=281105 RepID=A0A561UL87_9ACTN|nr:MBL fold metallo-hydrolase [Kitasatospora viridis]TWG00138.1 metallo-beta-lactamase superfamily protein [Kitasatospora viridis]
MRIHHLNTGSLRTIPPVEGDGPELDAVCHALLIETGADGLVLVDSGIGTGDLRDPDGSLGADWVAHARPGLRAEETALHQVTGLGFAPEDVRHIVLTHLHRDHTGGLPDFPHARVHLLADEYRAATDPAAAHHRHTLDRFMPTHRAHRPLLTPAQEPADWFGVAGVVRPEGLSAEVLLVPLPGHSAGHAGVAVRAADGGWLLHAGDAYMYHGEIDRTPPLRHPVFAPVQQGAQIDATAAGATLDLLRILHRDHGVTVFSAHDPWEFARLATPQLQGS